MSWSISLLGKPDNVVQALEAESTKLSGQSKVEFDDALPHLVGLVRQTFVTGDVTVPLIDLQASGSGSAKDGLQISRDCSVTIKRQYQRLC